MINPALNNAALLLGRVLLSVMFIMSGFSKIGGYAGTQGYMDSMGVPGALLPLVIVLEIAAGLAVLVGFQTRIAALLLGGFTLLAGYLFHFQPADQMQMISFMKNVSITGGFLALFVAGAGAWSVDGFRGADAAPARA